MTGTTRLHRLVLESGRLCAIVAFTGELVDADGSRVGIASRRAIVPAEIVRSEEAIALSMGPLDIDLLGFSVSVEPFTMPMGTGSRQQSGELDSRLAGATK